MRTRHLRPLMAAAAVLGLAWAGWSQRDAIAGFDWSVDRGRLALGVGLFAVAPLLQGLTFALGLRRVGAEGSTSALARMWARSFLLRYEPTGAVGFVYRVTARERVGASTAQVLTVTGYEPAAPGSRLCDAPCRIRTCDLVLRRDALYPAELRAPAGPS
jgi:hypothetical protein